MVSVGKHDEEVWHVTVAHLGTFAVTPRYYNVMVWHMLYAIWWQHESPQHTSLISEYIYSRTGDLDLWPVTAAIKFLIKANLLNMAIDYHWFPAKTPEMPLLIFKPNVHHFPISNDFSCSNWPQSSFTENTHSQSNHSQERRRMKFRFTLSDITQSKFSPASLIFFWVRINNFDKHLLSDRPTQAFYALDNKFYKDFKINFMLCWADENF